MNKSLSRAFGRAMAKRQLAWWTWEASTKPKPYKPGKLVVGYKPPEAPPVNPFMAAHFKAVKALNR